MAVCSLLLVPNPAQAETAQYSTSKTPYSPQQDIRTYQPPPPGFTAVFTELVSRHGSRTPTKIDGADLLLQLWAKARDESELTSAGQDFGPTMESYRAAIQKVGLGQETGRGRQELQGMADRMQRRLPELFEKIKKDATPIAVVLSQQTGRIADTAKFFTARLGATDPALAPLIQQPVVDQDLLYFHKTERGKAYRDYLENDQRYQETVKRIKNRDGTREAATDILKTIFTPAFVERMEPSAVTKAAQALYDLDAIAPDLSVEGNWHLDRFVPRHAAAWFASIDDAKSFYKKGPGFEGSDITFAMASILLDDFFKQAEAARAGKLGADLRFTHAEEIIPLAALMQLPGSEKQADPDEDYTYANNPWRGASVSPMAANLQWDIYRNGTTYLVRMLYQEKEIPFKPDCTPFTPGSHYYRLDELSRCFGRTAR
ncbi:histidine-type phosphatase [Amycolatopsis jejuensis]|uniref:histidine-type phosphatase n=1 Tax=Amycolatopsis jejuensis TaxID=330084 RepID=UPI000525271A|nr:histidine-type phosphatase [Amycolatopsis jejuensis]